MHVPALNQSVEWGRAFEFPAELLYWPLSTMPSKAHESWWWSPAAAHHLNLWDVMVSEFVD